MVLRNLSVLEYWNVPLSDDSAELTAFVTHRGLFEFVVLPFVLKVSPSGFMRRMDDGFSDFHSRGMFVYLDNIVMATNSLPHIFQLMDMVLNKCCERGYAVKLLAKKVFRPIRLELKRC